MNHPDPRNLDPPQRLAIPAKGTAIPWVNIGLLLATIVSTFVAGTLLAYSGFFGTELPSWISGLLFAATLLLILGTHELGHFFMARWHRVDASLPYFIPAPLGLGTFGAFIAMRGPTPNRRALFDVGLAGPVAGLLVAIPLFISGLFLAPLAMHPSLYGDGLLMTWLINLITDLRGSPPHHHLLPHPVAYAAYISLFITAVNLLPVGQLDGGHIAYALLGWGSQIFGLITFGGLIFLGWRTGWSSWYLWACLVLLFGLRHPPTADDRSAVGYRRWLLGGLALIALLLLFASNPFPGFG